MIQSIGMLFQRLNTRGVDYSGPDLRLRVVIFEAPKAAEWARMGPYGTDLHVRKSTCRAPPPPGTVKRIATSAARTWMVFFLFPPLGKFVQLIFG